MLNSVCLMGRLVDVPELKSTPSGVSVTTFTIAVPRAYVSAGQERQTDFIECVAWRTTAEFICKFFGKGRMIAVKGSIQTRNFEDKEGRKRKAVEVIVDNAYFTESKSDSAGQTETKNDSYTIVSDDADLPF